MSARDLAHRALTLTQAAENFRCNHCPNAGDHDVYAPEACEHCFPHFDDARVARIKALNALNAEAPHRFIPAAIWIAALCFAFLDGIVIGVLL